MWARRLRPAAGASAGVALLCAAALPARADRIDVAGEARLGTSISAASQGLLGASDGPCGSQTPVDGSFDVSGTVIGAFYGRSYRYQVAGSLGYYTPVCTTFLRRPVGGMDLRGEHALTERTRLSLTGRLVFDRFDRSNDARAGNPMAMDMVPAQPQPMTDLGAGQAAGTGFVQGSASIEVQHALSKRYGLRASFALRLFDAFATTDTLPEFSTLGPMYSGEFQLAGSRELPRDKIELPLRYRVSHFYPATLQKQPPPIPDPPPDPLPPAGPPGVLLSPDQVPPAHDLYLAGAWEHRFDPRFTLRVEAGPALMVQPHLCTVIDPAVIKPGEGCSIDKRAPGVRAFEAPPPLELPLGPLAGLTVAGEASLSYVRPRTRVEVKLARGYEPDPYAGALALIDRLALDYLYRPFWELTISGNLQLLHSAHTSLGRVNQPPANEAMMMMDRLQLVSPQNRTLYMALGNFSVDWQVRSFVSVFIETSFQVLAIRGERVPRDPMAMGGTEVQRFPQPVPDPMNPMGPPKEVPSWQETQRLTVLLGARLFFGSFPSLRREAELFTQARATP